LDIPERDYDSLDTLDHATEYIRHIAE